RYMGRCRNRLADNLLRKHPARGLPDPTDGVFLALTINDVSQAVPVQIDDLEMRYQGPAEFRHRTADGDRVVFQMRRGHRDGFSGGGRIFPRAAGDSQTRSTNPRERTETRGDKSNFRMMHRYSTPRTVSATRCSSSWLDGAT